MIVYRDSTGLVATSLPTPIPVKVGTFFDMADRLPPPWDSNGADERTWRVVPAARRYAADTAVYFTFGQLGQPNPVLVGLTGWQVIVVFPFYAEAQDPVEVRPLPLAAAVTELTAHVRTDWVGDDRTQQRHLPFAYRHVSAFTTDGMRLAAEVVDTAQTMVRWGHHGDPAPLLAALHPGGAAA